MVDAVHVLLYCVVMCFAVSCAASTSVGTYNTLVKNSTANSGGKIRLGRGRRRYNNQVADVEGVVTALRPGLRRASTWGPPWVLLVVRRAAVLCCAALAPKDE